MREIKFRAWSEEGNKMITPCDEMYCLENGTLYTRIAVWENMDQYRERKKNYDFEGVLMQYTGLKDKNGKDIYEGDILGEKLEIDGKMELCGYPVSWWAENAMFAIDISYLKDNTILDPMHEVFTGLEVIGNIYENPELLSLPSTESKTV